MKKTLIGILFFSLLVTFLCAQSADAEPDYAQQAEALFSSLFAGDVNVADQIDWNNIILFGTDYSAEFSAITDPQKRLEYKASFITAFSGRCIDEDLYPEDLYDWTTSTTSSSDLLVYADWYPDWLNLVFTKDGSKILLKEIYIEYDY